MKMETIKISVEVSVNLSESTQSFIKSLFTSTEVKQAEVKQAEVKQAEVKQAEVKQPEAPKSSKTIEDVRKALSLKVNEHREKIKQKLNELGAPSVTKLDASKYDELYNFLESL